MIYDYLDKWLTERCRLMEILLSYEIHRRRHVGFSGHLNLLASRNPSTLPRCTGLLFTSHTEYVTSYGLGGYGDTVPYISPPWREKWMETKAAE